MEEYQLTSIEIAQEAAHSRRYGKPKQLWRKDVLAMKWFCQACQEIQTPVSYCVGTRTVELSCSHFRSL